MDISFEKYEKFILDNEDFFYSFALPVIFPPYAAWAFSQEAFSHIGIGEGSSSKAKAGSFSSLALLFAYDQYSLARGLSTVKDARFAAMTMAKDLWKTRSISRATSRVVPLSSWMKYGGSAAIAASVAETNFEGFTDVYTAPVTGQKPSWIPLPLWVMFH